MVIAAMFALTFATVGCGDDKPTRSGQTEPGDLVGTWAISALEGAPGPVDASNSTWTFRSDGSYDWFFRYEPYFNVAGSGSYSVEGNVLTVRGIVRQTILAGNSEDYVTLSWSGNSFSFIDDEGDRWTYTK
jgi:hypothetical protein